MRSVQDATPDRNECRLSRSAPDLDGSTLERDSLATRLKALQPDQPQAVRGRSLTEPRSSAISAPRTPSRWSNRLPTTGAYANPPFSDCRCKPGHRRPLHRRLWWHHQARHARGFTVDPRADKRCHDRRAQHRRRRHGVAGERDRDRRRADRAGRQRGLPRAVADGPAERDDHRHRSGRRIRRCQPVDHCSVQRRNGGSDHRFGVRAQPAAAGQEPVAATAPSKGGHKGAWHGRQVQFPSGRNARPPRPSSSSHPSSSSARLVALIDQPHLLEPPHEPQVVDHAPLTRRVTTARPREARRAARAVRAVRAARRSAGPC